ncbi:hypothetical protein J4526_02480 [Desulfurococcaceae archaeon MEX13E-LK6-19]|nr:hypothetical protein J4526_02480 [Desulfurococcaceae archaeon MEX13E-LK6-19]
MKAASPLVATAMLLVATIAGGLILYNYILNTVSAPKDYVTLTPISARIVVSGTTGLLNIKVASMGTKPVNITAALIYPLGITVPINTEIKPGETISITKTFSTSGLTFNSNTKYFVVIYYGNGQSTEPIEAEVVIS